MKNMLRLFQRSEKRVIATFGSARLLEDRRGWLEIAGGSPQDRSEAMEWISLFRHDAVWNDAAHRAA